MKMGLPDTPQRSQFEGSVMVVWRKTGFRDPDDHNSTASRCIYKVPYSFQELTWPLHHVKKPRSKQTQGPGHSSDSLQEASLGPLRKSPM